MKTVNRAVVMSLCSALLLTACGGGGSAPSTATQPPITPPVAPPVAPSIRPANIQTTVPAFSYPTTSNEFAYATAINDFRRSLGLGLLAQHASLDTAARNHAGYFLNGIFDGGTIDFRSTDPATGISLAHIESPAFAGYTGTLPIDRVNFAGYGSTSILETINGLGNHYGQTAARYDVEILIGTAYHRDTLMNQYARDFGVAIGDDITQTSVTEIGYLGSTGPQRNASDYVGVYPVDQQTKVHLFFVAETPNPFPDLSNTNADFPTKTSYPISVTSEASTTLTVTQFTVTQSGSTDPLSARLLVNANDPNRILGENTAFLVGNAPFLPSTTYEVRFTGTVNGQAVARNWSFTTGVCTTYVMEC
jgi:hypothetical protein